MDRYNLLKNISEGRLGVTTPEYGYTVINDNIGKAYTLDLSVIATVAADKMQGKILEETKAEAEKIFAGELSAEGLKKLYLIISAIPPILHPWVRRNIS